MEPMNTESAVVQWYQDKTIFITGGTGFMGKVLIEKLLRSTPVKRIYMLVRPKKGVESKQRVEETLNSKLFNKLREHSPELLTKLSAIKGDITMEGLGIADADEEVLAREVNVVFHCAATINFQEPMRVAVSMNMLGTKRVINLAKKMANLKAMVHVSTAYANCHLQETYEELYPAPLDPARLIQLTEWLDDKVLDGITNDLVEPRPNTYTYTKALAEHILVNDAGNKIPFSIIRPSIVCGAWKEPVPGWVDNMFAFTGLLVGMGKGVLRSLYIKEGIKLDFVPVDVPINLMIVAGYNTAEKTYQHSHEVPIYCCSSGHQNPLTIEGLNDYLKDSVRQIPQENPVWFPDGSAKTNKTLHTIHLYAANIVPAYIYDFIRRGLGKKPFAVKLCGKMIKAINALEYFMLRDWTFHNENVQGLWSSLSPSDKAVFHFDMGSMNWGSYIEKYQKGVKKYILNEGIGDEDLARSHSNMNRMWYLYQLVNLLMLYMVYSVLFSDTSKYVVMAAWNAFMDSIDLSPPAVAAEESVLEATATLEDLGSS